MIGRLLRRWRQEDKTGWVSRPAPGYKKPNINTVVQRNKQRHADALARRQQRNR